MHRYTSMFVIMRAYLYIYHICHICLHTHIYIYIYIFHVCIYIYIYVIYVYIIFNVYAHTNTYIHIDVFILAHEHTYDFYIFYAFVQLKFLRVPLFGSSWRVAQEIQHDHQRSSIMSYPNLRSENRQIPRDIGTSINPTKY